MVSTKMSNTEFVLLPWSSEIMHYFCCISPFQVGNKNSVLDILLRPFFLTKVKHESEWLKGSSFILIWSFVLVNLLVII